MTERQPKTTADIDQYKLQLEARGRLTPLVATMIDTAIEFRERYDRIIYIAGALTGMSEETKERYAQTANLINVRGLDQPSLFGYAPHVSGTDPIKHPHVTGGEVRDIDHLWAVRAADHHVNFISPAALGNGIEEGWAEAHDIPSLYVVPRGERISRITLGMWNVAGVVAYDDFHADGLDQIANYFDTYQAAISASA